MLAKTQGEAWVLGSPDTGVIQRRLPDDSFLNYGPYVVHSLTGRVYSVLKLYDDFNNTFVSGTLRHESGRYQWLEGSTRIPVPPRLGFGDVNADRPLSGMRFAVKDVIDVAGLETGNGSKCYREFYSPRDKTAACIERLTDAGAIMVGKLRCGQWCDGQDPLERMEEVTPTNPRGDGCQKPSGSSSGSAAACASYDWLDFTIGTDTGGSVRHPAAVNGVYGLRPSTHSMESSGLVCCDGMDTPGVFARSAKLAESVYTVMLNDDFKAEFKPEKKLRYRLLYAVEPEAWDETQESPKLFPPGPQQGPYRTSADHAMAKFVADLQYYLDCKRDAVCIDDLWKATRPPDMPADLAKATGNIYKNLVYSPLSWNVIRPFVREYHLRHGKKPFIEEITQRRLDYGREVSKDELTQAARANRLFSTWVNEVLLPRPATDEDEIPILVYPQSWGTPRYRNDLGRLATGQTFWDGFSVYSLSYCSGCPDFTLPVGETQFVSKFTGSSHSLPVAISIMAPKDMDLVLLKIIADLERQGILSSVSCGPSLQPSAR